MGFTANRSRQRQVSTRKRVSLAEERTLSPKNINPDEFKIPLRTPKQRAMPATWTPGSGFDEFMARLDITTSSKSPCAQRKLAHCRSQPAKRTLSPTATVSTTLHRGPKYRKREGNCTNGYDSEGHYVSDIRLATMPEGVPLLKTPAKADVTTCKQLSPSEHSTDAISRHGTRSNNNAVTLNENTRFCPSSRVSGRFSRGALEHFEADESNPWAIPLEGAEIADSQP